MEGKSLVWLLKVDADVEFGEGTVEDYVAKILYGDSKTAPGTKLTKILLRPPRDIP